MEIHRKNIKKNINNINFHRLVYYKIRLETFYMIFFMLKIFIKHVFKFL